MMITAMCAAACFAESVEPWARHVIDNTSRGADGDLDVLTCEERANLGVIWYENPTR
jgi:hypothetical protein